VIWSSCSYIETFESVPVPKDAIVPSFSQAGITYIGILLLRRRRT
jgi:hypothetical protein